MIGITVKARTRDYVVPSLTLDEALTLFRAGTLKRVPMSGLGILVGLFGGEGPGEAPIDAALDVILIALRHNYPEITREEISREVDLDGVERMVSAVLASSGLLKKQADAGEATPQTR